MGTPSKSGKAVNIPILGEHFGFDRYDDETLYHFEYGNLAQTCIKKIPLMSLETAP